MKQRQEDWTLLKSEAVVIRNLKKGQNNEQNSCGYLYSHHCTCIYFLCTTRRHRRQLATAIPSGEPKCHEMPPHPSAYWDGYSEGRESYRSASALIVLGHLAANLSVVLMTVIRAAVFQVKALRFPIVLSIIPFNNAIDILPKTRSQICNSGSLLG